MTAFLISLLITKPLVFFSIFELVGEDIILVLVRLQQEKNDRNTIHHIIYDELCAGKIQPDSKQKYADIIGRLVKEGAEGVILGCTEIGLLVKQEDSPVLLFDTTAIHAEAAVKYALSNAPSLPGE